VWRHDSVRGTIRGECSGHRWLFMRFGNRAVGWRQFAPFPFSSRKKANFPFVVLILYRTRRHSLSIPPCQFSPLTLVVSQAATTRRCCKFTQDLNARLIPASQLRRRATWKFSTVTCTWRVSHGSASSQRGVSPRAQSHSLSHSPQPVDLDNLFSVFFSLHSYIFLRAVQFCRLAVNGGVL
jgi:hypothetical protein